MKLTETEFLLFRKESIDTHNAGLKKLGNIFLGKEKSEIERLVKTLNLEKNAIRAINFLFSQVSIPNKAKVRRKSIEEKISEKTNSLLDCKTPNNLLSVLSPEQVMGILRES